MEVYIEIWENLTVATTLGEPKDVGADIDEIVAIGEEWAARKRQEQRANTAETSKWAAHVAEAGFNDHITHDDEPFAGVQLHGSETADELAPEDAIDERGGPNAHRDEATSPSSIIIAVDRRASVAVSHDAAEETHGVEEDRRSETTGASHARLVREDQRTKATVSSRLKSWFQQMFCA